MQAIDTLTTPPVAPLLARLFAEADAQSPLAAFGDVAPPELERLLRSRTDYRDLYGRLKDAALPVSRATGTLLYLLARTGRARSIVEFGTSFGISTLHLAAALRDNGGGLLVTTEFEPAKVERARANLDAAGLADLVEIRTGDALQTLAGDLPATIDLVLLDGAKALYPDVLALLEPRLRPGAIVVADNADHSPDYLERVRDPASGYVSLPFGGDVELSVRLA
jgi:predicted O-methyltransferase YrrM